MEIVEIGTQGGSGFEAHLEHQYCEYVNVLSVAFCRCRENAIYPTKGSKGAACFDLYACLGEQEVVGICPGETKVIPTGWNVAMHKNVMLEIRPRSGLAAKSGITVLNTPGTIDSDYCGIGEKFEVKVILHNTSKNTFVVRHGDRIAQCMAKTVEFAIFREIDEKEFAKYAQSEASDRVGGLGSTGV